MPGKTFAQWLRFGAVALFSIVLASCGGGSGESSVNVPAEEAASAEMRLVFADYFGDAPATNSKTIAKAPLPPGTCVFFQFEGGVAWSRLAPPSVTR